MTIYDTIVDKFYNKPFVCMKNIAININKEIKELQNNGCTHIQLDEPVYARYPENVILYADELLNICFKDITIHKSLHICCGYPDKLEETDYLKSDINSYHKIAKILDNSIIDSISIEDAHRHNNLEKLLKLYKNKIIILGVIKIATITLEDTNYIVNRIQEALKYISKDRLWISPDCGLGMLPINIAIQKLKIMQNAVNIVNK